MSDDVLAESAESFAVFAEDFANDFVDDSAPAIPAQTAPKPKRKDNVTGRAAFAGDFCDIHGPHPSGFPCAKFYGLPGKGRGIKQPSISYILFDIFRSVVPLLMVVALLFAGIWVLQNTILSGGSVLRSGNVVQPTACPMPDGSQQPTNSGLPCNSPNPNGGAAVSPDGVPSDPAVGK